MTSTTAAAVRALALMWRAAPGWSAGFAVLSLVAGVVVPVNAWLLARVLDAVTTRGDGVAAMLLLGAVTAGGAVVGPATRYAEGELARRVGLRAKSTLMRAVTGVTGLELLERPAFLDRLRLAEQAGAGAPQVLAHALFAAVQAIVTAAGLALVLAAVGPWLVLVTAAGCVPAVVAAVAESRDRARMMWQTTPGTRREMFYATLLTDARAATEIRVFGLGGLLNDRMTAELRQLARAQRAVDRRTAVVQAGLAVSGAGLSAAAMLWGAGQAAAGRITVGELSMLVVGVAGLQVAAAGVVRAFGDGHHGALIFAHLDAVLASTAAESVRSLRRSLPAASRSAGVELRDVTFRYAAGHAPVLRGVSFAIPPGAMVALVGTNGAGKSTVVKLLCRLYEATSGTILWNGDDIVGLDARAVRRRIGVLFQDFVRYDLPVADNIGFGDLDRLDDEPAIRRAARLAGVDAVAERLPQGYGTMLSRAFGGTDDADGVQLSGGQWQRVALARSLMRTEAELMILDEPSSGLDADAEAALYQHLRTARGGRSCLLVTHRLGAVRHADAIVVLAGGRVAEQGTHDQLLAAGGEYARLYQMQAGGYGRRADVAAG
ncbi:ABC transporter ATP-binding protein [Jiangella asiatica]|uniref:ABC transporter ATP-binding protein n=1 Tax=Jiangella asiatica TaxID=2530372 RepID=A0A4R5CR31_9ACTN|nr:ABC transporter ATP-binding protein [Jiangella asiatica]TDE01810.1 ABC transporter ATP-binding protein [Jiangella asiatica]